MTLRKILIAPALLALAACAEPGVVPFQPAATDASILREVRVTGTVIDTTRMQFAAADPVATAAEVETAMQAAADTDMRYIVGTRPTTVRLVVLTADLGTSGRTILGGGQTMMTGTAALLDAATGAPLAPPVEVRALFNPGVNTEAGVIDGADFRGENAVVLDLTRQFVERARQQLFGS